MGPAFGVLNEADERAAAAPGQVLFASVTIQQINPARTDFCNIAAPGRADTAQLVDRRPRAREQGATRRSAHRRGVTTQRSRTYKSLTPRHRKPERFETARGLPDEPWQEKVDTQ